MKKLASLVLLLAMLCGCGAGPEMPPASTEAAAPSSMSEASSAPSSSASSPAPASSSPASSVGEPLTSARFYQETQAGWLLWEKVLTEPETLALVQSLLDASDLRVLEDGDSRWTDGGINLSFELVTGEAVVEGTCNPDDIIKKEKRCTLRLGEVFYGMPQERAELLLAFLDEQNIQMS